MDGVMYVNLKPVSIVGGYFSSTLHQASLETCQQRSSRRAVRSSEEVLDEHNLLSSVPIS